MQLLRVVFLNLSRHYLRTYHTSIGHTCWSTIRVRLVCRHLSLSISSKYTCRYKYVGTDTKDCRFGRAVTPHKDTPRPQTFLRSSPSNRSTSIIMLENDSFGPQIVQHARVCRHGHDRNTEAILPNQSLAPCTPSAETNSAA